MHNYRYRLPSFGGWVESYDRDLLRGRHIDNFIVIPSSRRESCHSAANRTDVDLLIVGHLLKRAKFKMNVIFAIFDPFSLKIFYSFMTSVCNYFINSLLSLFLGQTWEAWLLFECFCGAVASLRLHLHGCLWLAASGESSVCHS